MDESHSSLLAIGGCVIFLAIISASIAAVSNVRLGILKRQGEEENKKAKKLLKLLEDDKDNILLGLWVVYSFITIITGAMTVLWSSGNSPEKSFHVYHSLGIIILITIIFGLIIPRVISSLFPEAFCTILYPLIKVVGFIFVPLTRLFTWIFSPILSRFNQTDKETLRLAEEEIKWLVEEGQEKGVLEEEEIEMIQSIFDFGDTIAREVMVPRVDMICADINAGVLDVMKIISESGFSRIPIYEDSVDKIKGIVYAKDLLSYIGEDKLTTLAIDMANKPPFFVPGIKNVDDLLREMRQRSISIAIVVDEYGGTDGLITIEDMLEEIVGEITDEHDRETPDIIDVGNNSFLVDAGTVIEDVNDELEIKVPSDNQETIGGFVYGTLGHIPKQGEKLSLEDLGVEITVEDVQGQRITSLLINKLSMEEKE